MQKTYTLFLCDGTDRIRFEPALARTDAEALARARELLSLHPECHAVEVMFGNQHLFRVEAKPAP